MHDCKLLGELGNGVFGTVHLVNDTTTGYYAALKTVRFDETDDGVPGWAIRQVSILRSLDHPNIIRLLRVHMDEENSQLGLVFELMDMDVKAYMRLRGPFIGQRLVASINQCLRGLNYCHQQSVIHRDFKPQSLLIATNTMQIKLANFEAARTISRTNGPCTREVVTLWYRPPELLLGASTCNASVDMWSLGCVAFEMASGRPLFQGDSEIGTMFKIFHILGTPTESLWPGVSQLPFFMQHCPMWQPNFSALCRQYPNFPRGFMYLVRSTLNYMPQARPSARKLLGHTMFWDIRFELEAIARLITDSKSKPAFASLARRNIDNRNFFMEGVCTRLMVFLDVPGTF